MLMKEIKENSIKKENKKAVCLISSGIDSPVAAYLMIKNNYSLVFAHSLNYKDNESLEKVKKIISILNKIAGKKHKLYLIKHYMVQEAIKSKCNKRYQCVLCKRAMYRNAEKIAKIENAKYIITGESLSQVASQTLENMSIIDKAAELVVMRPLIAMSKEKTISIAKEIGTYNISIQKEKPCPYLPKSPVTKAKPDKVEKEEEKYLPYLKKELREELLVVDE